MAQIPAAADLSPQTSEFENFSPGTSGNFGESDWTEADDSSVAEPAALFSSNSNIPSLNQSLPDAEETAREGGGQELYSTFREIEVAGHKVANFTKTAAADISSKLFGGGGAVSRETAETHIISDLTEGVSHWWSSLNTATSTPEGPSRRSASLSGSQVPTDAQLFALPATEKVLESFQNCTLLQTYSCSHNSFTPDREVKWKGKLVITDRQSCWRSDIGSGDVMTLMLPHSDVSSAHQMARGGKDLLQVNIGAKEWLSLEFAAARDTDAALALLEHVTSSS